MIALAVRLLDPTDVADKWIGVILELRALLMHIAGKHSTVKWLKCGIKNTGGGQQSKSV